MRLSVFENFGVCKSLRIRTLFNHPDYNLVLLNFDLFEYLILSADGSCVLIRFLMTP